MPFSCKIILSDYKKDDGVKRVYLQAIIDRRKAMVPLGFYLKEDDFDFKKQTVRLSHPNASTLSAEILKAISRAHHIASIHRLEEKPFTPTIFREAFREDITGKDSLVKFIEGQLQLKRPDLAHGTWKQHKTVINKLTDFRKQILFSDVSADMVQKFKNHLSKENGASTVNKLLKILKHYLQRAEKKGIKFPDPDIRLKNFSSSRTSLSEQEVERLHDYYTHPDCKENHRKVLRYFLFSCYTGVRIGDIKFLNWENVHDDMLIYVPKKTERIQKVVYIPLIDQSRRYLSRRKKGATLFETISDQKTNKLLKDIADECDIKKKVTYHMSRHTFATMIAELGDIMAVKMLMGHGDIKTSAGYVHTSTQTLVKAMKKRFD